ncbi:hypothetical protein F6V30_13910 [Oryzomonas sagensis]|uniref:Pili assembly chaperone n=1 Tax=Oryzomonas sagensis TaxID=2603857 RepID=A0ABQ6TLK5_9BACT|nr:hypothetical protein [Oryzomonas sagensis]KAB0668928.1 hypothetical protein F6V30_13910 [Oryzomonas sagensis]
MKKLILLVTMLVACMAVAAFGADPVAVVAPATVTPAATVGFLDWFKQNTSLVLGVALALSELLAAIPAFKGNGILDSIIKGLVALSGKTPPPAA